MYPSILLPLDGSEFAEGALPLARRLARKLGSDLHLVHVIRQAPDADLKSPQEDLDWKGRVRDGAEVYLHELSTSLENEGIRVHTAVLDGRVVDSLDGYTREKGIPLVVMTTHGAGGLQRFWLGSVADGLLRRGSASLLLARPWDDTEDRPEPAELFRHLAVPLDGSENGELALGPAEELRRAFGAELTLLRVVPRPVELTSIYGVPGVRVEGEGHRGRQGEAEAYLAAVAERIGDPAPSTRVVESGGAAEGVIEGARKAGADLLVLSTHGRSGFERTVLGSVADKVIRGTTLPALVIRPPREG
jgi:nucleotide-binding universal stress UspA family protein